MLIVQEVQYQFNNIEELIAWCEQEALITEEALGTLATIKDKGLGEALMAYLEEASNTFYSKYKYDMDFGLYNCQLNAELTEDKEHLFSELELINKHLPSN